MSLSNALATTDAKVSDACPFPPPNDNNVGVSEVAFANEDAKLNVFASTTYAKYEVPLVNPLSCVPPAV